MVILSAWCYIEYVSNGLNFLQCVGEEASSALLLPDMCYNGTTGCYESLRFENRFTPLFQRESLTSSVCPIRSGEGVDETVAGRNQETVHAMRHLVLEFLFKLKNLLSKKSIYNLEDEELLHFHAICSLLLAHGTALPFFFPRIG